MPKIKHNENQDFNENEYFTNAGVPQMPTNLPPAYVAKQTGLPPRNLPPVPHPMPSVLSKYFRVAGPHVQLATDGVYMPEGTIEFTQNHDIPIWPMSGADEILLKSPDALMSGLALEKLFESCVPAIKYPRLINTPDIDVLLIAIRVATYGPKHDISGTCPKCKAENTFECDLPTLLKNMKKTDKDGSVRLSDDVVVSVRPYTLDDATQLALLTFEETRRIQGLNLSDSDDVEKSREISKAVSRITKINKEIMTNCISYIAVPEGKVMDKRDIIEFVSNVPKPWVDKIENKVKSLNESGVEKTMEVTCSSCEHVWKTEVEFDPANFFEE